MDPCLEDPQLWPGVHNRAIVYLADQLLPQLRPKYIAAVEERVFVEGPGREIVPDVWVKYERSSAARQLSGAEVDEPLIVHLVSVNRARGARDEFEIYPRRLADRLPRIRIPLADGDADVALDLQQVLDQTFAQGSYGDRIDYGAPCRPPLSVDQQAWAAAHLNSTR